MTFVDKPFNRRGREQIIEESNNFEIWNNKNQNRKEDKINKKVKELLYKKNLKPMKISMKKVIVFSHSSLKDHKGNFKSNSTVTLVNAREIAIERIRKVVLDKIKPSIIEQLKVNQWKNTNCCRLVYKNWRKKQL